jgi:hypothetical protein
VAGVAGLAGTFRAIAGAHAARLDARNGDDGKARWLRALRDQWFDLPKPGGDP